LLGTRPDKARIFIADQDLTINMSGQTISKSETIVINHGNLVIDSDIKYTPYVSGNMIPSIAFVVLDGDIIINPHVTQLDGVYVVKGEHHAIRNEGTTPSMSQLVINGSLYGNMDDLMKYRTYVGLPEENGASVIVNYDARIVSHTPPGLKDILGGMLFDQVAK
jgi:hypothetical protein